MAPLCVHAACPPGFEQMRRLKSSDEDGFGASCLWPGSAKSFCCKEDGTHRTWAGRWQRSTSGRILRYEYVKKNVTKNSTECGSLNCWDSGRFVNVPIMGPECKEIIYIDDEEEIDVIRDGEPSKATLEHRLHGRVVYGLIQFDCGPRFKCLDRFYKIL